jgi:hypothetical protein
MSLDFCNLPLNLINRFEILLCGIFEDQLAFNLDHRSTNHIHFVISMFCKYITLPVCFITFNLQYCAYEPCNLGMESWSLSLRYWPLRKMLDELNVLLYGICDHFKLANTHLEDLKGLHFHNPQCPSSMTRACPWWSRIWTKGSTAHWLMSLICWDIKRQQLVEHCGLDLSFFPLSGKSASWKNLEAQKDCFVWMVFFAELHYFQNVIVSRASWLSKVPPIEVILGLVELEKF